MATSPSTPSAPHRWPPTGGTSQLLKRPAVGWLVALILVAGLAIVGWFRPASHNNGLPSKPAAYTDQQTAGARATLCTAFGNVDHALDLADSRSTGPTAQLSVATSTRQVLDAGSRYLLAKLAEEPATPPDLAAAIRNQAGAYQDVVIGHLDGLTYSDPGLKAAGSASNQATDTIRQLCK